MIQLTFKPGMTYFVLCEQYIVSLQAIPARRLSRRQEGIAPIALFTAYLFHAVS